MNNRKRKLKQKKKEKLNIIMSLIGLVCVQFIVVGLVIVVINSINFNVSTEDLVTVTGKVEFLKQENLFGESPQVILIVNSEPYFSQTKYFNKPVQNLLSQLEEETQVTLLVSKEKSNKNLWPEKSGTYVYDIRSDKQVYLDIETYNNKDPLIVNILLFAIIFLMWFVFSFCFVSKIIWR